MLSPPAGEFPDEGPQFGDPAEFQIEVRFVCADHALDVLVRFRVIFEAKESAKVARRKVFAAVGSTVNAFDGVSARLEQSGWCHVFKIGPSAF